MVRIYFPEKFDRDTLGPFFEELDKNLNVDEVVIDCSSLKYSHPTAMLVAGSKIRTWIKHRRDENLKTFKSGVHSSDRVHSYLMHIGFFDYILMGDGKPIGEAYGSSTYLPITRIIKPEFDVENDSLDEWYERILSPIRGLVKVLSGTVEDTQVNRLYKYALREIIRNVFEHSEAEECYVCGQRWSSGRVEVAVLDEGVGIYKTLSNSFEIENDVEALKMAIRPGFSRTAKLSDEENIYDNSGYGLYVLSQLASSFGWFVLGSGRSRILGFKNEITEEPLNFSGTYFGMHLNSHPKSFSGVLEDIVSEGEVEAGEFGITRKASGLSRML